MIRLRQPSLVLHAHDVPGYSYTMSTVRCLPPSTKPREVVDLIKLARKNCDGTTLYNVVINCHGGQGALCTGGDSSGSTDIDISNVNVFSKLADPTYKDLYTIWLVACEVARADPGQQFCAELARTSRCNVVAADKSQYVNRVSLPHGCIDKYEGQVYLWDPTGKRKTIRGNARKVAGTR